MNYVGSIFSFVVALAILEEVKKITKLTDCYTELEALHRKFCEATPSQGLSSEKTCLGWSLDSRRLPSGCYFRIKKI